MNGRLVRLRQSTIASIINSYSGVGFVLDNPVVAARAVMGIVGLSAVLQCVRTQTRITNISATDEGKSNDATELCKRVSWPSSLQQVWLDYREGTAAMWMARS